MTTGAAGTCPQCGAPLRFGGANSLATVCAYCRNAVARAGADLSLAGKVPDLVATDTRLGIGSAGHLAGKSFTVLGRIQLDQGAGAWNEWYTSFDDGGFGWLAEAMGRLYCTRKVDAPATLPRAGSLYAGQELKLPGYEPFAIDEVGRATLVSAEGELPFRPQLGQSYLFADATSELDGFLTLDYGTEEGAAPELFVGRQLDYADAGLADQAPVFAPGREKARALTCPECGGPLELKLAAAKSATCPSCRALLDVEGQALRPIQVLAQRTQPAIPLGATGKLRGERVEVLGFLRRYVSSEGVDYEWREYLLHGPGGYRFLSEYDGHWLYLRPLPGGKIREYRSGSFARCDGRRFRHFQTGSARFREAQGEFYWRLSPDDVVVNEDYVAPPYLLSREQEPSRPGQPASEVNWSRGEWIAGDEIWKGLTLKGAPPRARGVAPAQPNPFTPQLGPAWRSLGLAVLALLAVAGVLNWSQSHAELATLTLPASQALTLSEPFEVGGGPARAVRVVATSDASPATWVGVDAALVSDQWGQSQEMAFELSPDESGGQRGEGIFSSVSRGRYVLRIEPQWATGTQPTGVLSVRAYRGAFRSGLLVLALAALLVYPLSLAVRSARFEQRRWAESDSGS